MKCFWSPTLFALLCLSGCLPLPTTMKMEFETWTDTSTTTPEESTIIVTQFPENNENEPSITITTQSPIQFDEEFIQNQNQYQNEQTTDIIIEQRSSTSTATSTSTSQPIASDSDEHKKEIMAELENIWNIKEELGDDQSGLKSSLQSLISFAVPSLNEERGNEELAKLKQLLRKLRARLLLQDEEVNFRKKRSIDGNVLDPEENSVFSGEAGKENSIFKEEEEKFKEKTGFLYSFEKLEKNSEENLKKVKENETKLEEKNPESLPSSNENYPEKVKTTEFNLDQEKSLEMEKTPKKSSEEDNFVRVTIFHQAHEIPGPTTPLPNFAGNLNSKYPGLITLSKYQTLSPQKVMELKHKYQSFKITPKPTTTSTLAPKPQLNIDDIIQSIIDVLRSPIQSPVQRPQQVFTKNKTEAGGEVINPSPSILNKISAGFLNSTEAPSSNSTNNTSSALYILQPTSVITEVVTSPTVMNEAMDKVFTALDTFSNMPNGARFVLLFSIAISVLSIAAGVYSLGPPIIAMGVLSIIVPIFLLFLILPNTGRNKQKGKEDLNLFSSETFIDVLDLISDAMLKYESKQG